MPEPLTVRQQVFEKLRAALGEPEVSMVRSGSFYRWTLRRPYEMNLYVTMDSPEREDLGHIMLSDGPKHQDEPVVDFTLYTLEEADGLLERIMKQWGTSGGRDSHDGVSRV